MRTSALGRLQSGRTFVYTPFPVSPRGQSPPPTLSIGRTLLIREELAALPPLNPPSLPVVEPLILPPPVPLGEASRLGCLCILDCRADGGRGRHCVWAYALHRALRMGMASGSGLRASPLLRKINSRSGRNKYVKKLAYVPENQYISVAIEIITEHPLNKPSGLYVL